MAVFYRYRSRVDTFSVPVPEPFVSVGELKRLITATARHGHGRSRGRGPGTADKTGEEYADEDELIPSGCTVVVRRRVSGPPAETIVELTVKKPMSEGGGSSSDSGAPSTGAEVDDEEKAISSVIDAAQLKWEAPTRPASGESDGVIPAELYCKICRNVMADAVVTSKCCFDSFCDGCIRDHIASKSKCACGAQARADDLIPNTTLRTTIANLLATTTGAAASASSGTDKTRSSAGSNAAHPAAPLSPAASQASRSSNVSSEKAEHSDGGASTSKKIATISGALGPRKAQETVAGDHSAESGARAVHGGDHYGVPFCPATGYVDPFFFGGMPFGADPYMYYGGVPYGCGGAPNGYYGGEELRDRKRARVSPGTGCW
ncbi:hypothetical protein DAI22_03g167700 [Oryza sativa Japonica Group]|nr:hypothetical protein DAI22_03g167700 [Oryza sativa Japonica Group]